MLQDRQTSFDSHKPTVQVSWSFRDLVERILEVVKVKLERCQVLNQEPQAWLFTTGFPMGDRAVVRPTTTCHLRLRQLLAQTEQAQRLADGDVGLPGAQGFGPLPGVGAPCASSAA